jgi:hypothetical protein
MPALDAGDIALAQRRPRQRAPAAAVGGRGFKIAVVNPTCSLMMRKEYPELLRGEDGELAAAAERVAAATRDLGEYLYELRAAGHFKEDFRSTPNADVAYHAPCHLRMQNIGFRGRDLMRRIPGVKPKLVAECCGHDGTWAMKKEYFALSLKNGEKAFEGMRATGAALWTSDCPLAALQFEQACGTTVPRSECSTAPTARTDSRPGSMLKGEVHLQPDLNRGSREDEQCPSRSPRLPPVQAPALGERYATDRNERDSRQDEYERQRPDLRRRIMTLKAKRRVPLGDHATLHFETRDTMLYQVHEMLRAEDSWQRPGAVEAELEAYNPLIPSDGALSATLMIEYETPWSAPATSASSWVSTATSGWRWATPPCRCSSCGAASPTHLLVSMSAGARRRAGRLWRDGTVLRVVLDHPLRGRRCSRGDPPRATDDRK